MEAILTQPTTASHTFLKKKLKIRKSKTNLSGLQLEGSAGEGTGLYQLYLNRNLHLGGKLVKTEDVSLLGFRYHDKHHD